CRAMSTDDVGRDAFALEIGAQLEEQRRRGAVEMIDAGEIEIEPRRRRDVRGEPPHVLPRSEALAESQLTGEAQRAAVRGEIEPLDAVRRVAIPAGCRGRLHRVSSRAV